MKAFWIVHSIALIIGILLGIYVSNMERVKIKTEYQLEILNQDSIKVYSNSTERIYIVPFDEVETVLLKDNL